MTLTHCETGLLRRLAELPFADRLDLAALSGWSKGAVYAGMAKLTEGGMASAIPHATSLLPPSRRYYLTAHGLRWLAEDQGTGLDELLRRRPVSAQWRRVLLERLDALAVIYRLAAAVSNVAFPIGIQLFRAAPADAGIVLPYGHTIAVVRQGLTADRTGFSKRLWRLREGPLPGGVLVLAPDEVRLRQARRMLASARFPSSWPWSAMPPWPAWTPRCGVPLPSPPSWTCATSCPTWTGAAGCRWRPRPARAVLPAEIDLDCPASDCLLPALLGPAEKRALDLLSDWPWASKRDLAGLMGVSERRVSQLVAGLEEFGLVSHANAQGTRRLALSDRGLGLLARRDRTSVGTARRRWGVAPIDPLAPLTWRNVSGSRSRQLLRNVEHTGAVHWFLVALAAQARAAGWEVVQLDPPRRASRYFRHEGRLHSALPDAFGMSCGGAMTRPYPSSWSGSAGRCAPSPWRRGWPPTSTITPPGGP